KSYICKTFGISRPTLDSWLKIEKEGDLFEVKKFRHGRLSRVNLEELKKYIYENPDQYYHEIAKKFGIKKSQAHNLITKKLGYTSKKNRRFTMKRTQKQKLNLKQK
ncbi:MAG: IS630 transposase-related protein, partial [Dolichospermum sp.]